MWFGAGIAWLDRMLNRPGISTAARRGNGVLAVMLLVLATAGPASLLQSVLLSRLPAPAALLLLGLLSSTLLAQRSLYQHVRAVGDGLRQNGLAGGRAAVAHIVGRNPESLDEAGVVRAAIESLAENFSDGVVAPAFWCALGGLPGLVFYKAVNTADSMIGHRTERHATFGWAAARLDDAINLPASRLAAIWIVLASMLASAAPLEAWRAVWRDAGKHRSPNAGWPEAAMAGALGLKLAGPRVYGTTRIDDGWMGNGRAEAILADLDRALALYRRACLLQLVVVVMVVVVRARDVRWHL